MNGLLKDVSDAIFTGVNQDVIAERGALVYFTEEKTWWRIGKILTNATEIPNYLDYCYLDALEQEKPETVSKIH